MIEYRNIDIDEITLDLFKNFVRHQVVDKCWRKEDGKWIIKSDPFIDDWSLEDYRFLINCLRNTLLTGGFVYGAFIDNELKGFVSVEAEIFDNKNKYCDLSSLHISEDMRHQGIGKRLFYEAKSWAKQNGGLKLYISAHSAIESIAFYQAMGCIEAKSYNQNHVDAEPFDCQLECLI